MSRSRQPGLDVHRLLAPVERLEFEVLPHETGWRVDQFLARHMAFTSRQVIQGHARQDRVEIRGRSARPSTRVRSGDLVTIDYHKSGRDLSPPSDLDFPILFEDEWLLVIDKPAGVPVHPAGDEVARTVLTALVWQAGEGSYRRLPHRLDRETSGVLVVTKDPVAQSRLSEAFQRGTVRKEYVAVVEGVIESDRGRITAPLRRDGYRSVPAEAGRGQQALTDWKVERRGVRHTRLRLFPRTGRRHQIRAHLHFLGHSIVGDKLYGNAPSASPRLALHAASVALRHPVHDHPRRFDSAVPTDQAFEVNPDPSLPSSTQD